MDIDLSQLDGLSNSSNIWTYVGKVLFFCFKSRRICFFICFAAPSKFLVIFWLVRTIALDILRFLDSVGKYCMTPLPAVFTLGNAWIHVSIPNSSNILANIEASVNESLSFTSALDIPNVYPDNRHVQFRQNLDNSWFGHQVDIIKDLVLL